MKKESLKQTIRQGISGLFHICTQELKAVFKDQERSGSTDFFPASTTGLSAGIRIYLHQ